VQAPVLCWRNDLKNAGLGALAGGVVGAAVGAYMDHQEEEMQQSLQGTGIEVQRTAENTLNLTMLAVSPWSGFCRFNTASKNGTGLCRQGIKSIPGFNDYYHRSYR